MRSLALILSLLLMLLPACSGSRGTSNREGRPRAQRGLAVRWHRDGIGMSDSFLPSGGRLLAADGERVYAASGFGDAGMGAPRHTVIALDRETGETRWAISRSGPAFLQGVAGHVLVVNEQHNLVAGVEASTGTERWAVDLSTLGLGGYGANVSAFSDDLVVMGLSAQGEADTSPPVIAAIDAANGELRWRTTLTPGTDLNFGTPAVVDGAAVFLSTPSHPGSAPGGMAHAVDLSDGAVRWALDLGGGQGFHAVGAAVSRGGVHVPGPGVVFTVDPASGAVRWRREAGPLAAPAVVGDKLFLLTQNAIAVVDPVTGEELSYLAEARQFLGVHLLIPVPRKPVLLAIDRLEGRAVDPRNLATAWSQKWPAPLVDVPLVTSDRLIASTGDRRVTEYEIPKPKATTGTAPPPTTPEKPRTFTGEAARVAKVVDTWLNADSLDATVGAIEDGTRLRGTIKFVLEHAPGPLGAYSGRVDDVHVVDKGKADITFSVLLNGSAVVDHRKGRAVRIKGKWKVTRKTVCELIALGGTRCPHALGGV
jgi:outer membrane protein assembly factor BamB